MPDAFHPAVAAALTTGNVIREQGAHWRVTAIGTGRGARMFDVVCTDACGSTTVRRGDHRRFPLDTTSGTYDRKLPNAG